MNALFKIIRSDKILFNSFILSIIIQVFSIAYLLFFYRNLPPFIPLFNQFSWGEDRLAPTINIYSMPFIAGLTLMVNIILAGIVYKRMPLAARFFSITTLLISCFVVLLLMRTIELVR